MNTVEKSHNKLDIQEEPIERKIFFIRGQKVMVDFHLAQLYGVTTGNLNKAVRRNIDRFPPDFMFQLSSDEYDSLRFQIGILKHGAHSKYLPLAFTEQGVAMLSSILRSKIAAHINIAIMRAFVRLRQTLSSHKEFAYKLRELENKVASHDQDIIAIFNAIKQLMKEEEKPKNRIGFL